MRYVLVLSFLTVGCADETISGYADRDGIYRLVELDGTAFESRATISFPEKGRIVGSGPCNAYSAAQTAPYPWIEIGPVVATRRACPDLEAEQRFFSALSASSLAEVTGSVLILSGDVEMVFEKDR